MVQTTFKWKCVFFSSVILFNVFGNTLQTTDNIKDLVVTKAIEDSEKVTVLEKAVNATRDGSRLQFINRFDVEITVSEDSFDGHAVLDVGRSLNTEDDAKIILHVKDLLIKCVKVGVLNSINVVEADFYVENDLLHIIQPDLDDSSSTNRRRVVVIDYSGKLANDGRGIYLGQYNQNKYVAMNLYPSYARRVFPCMYNHINPVLSFKFVTPDYSSLVSNSMLEENSTNLFRPLRGPIFSWGMIAHNLVHSTTPTVANVLLYGRPEIRNQDSLAVTAINFFYANLNEWTAKEYTEISPDQFGSMNIFGLPDVSRDWNTLSIIGIWEPFLFMEPNSSVKQRSIALPKIAEAMAKQWFGYVIYPYERDVEWIVSGFASYAGWEMMRKFQAVGKSELDVNTLFVTDVIQESLLRDAYSSSKALQPESRLLHEHIDVVRELIGVNGILKYKTPALMRMLRIVLDDARTDCIQWAAKAILLELSLFFVDLRTFIEGVNSCSVWLGPTNSVMVGEFEDFLEPWIKTNGYPLLHITRVNNAVIVVQETFGFSNKDQETYQVPITYTTSRERNFSDDNMYPVTMLDSVAKVLNVPLDSDDWILFNIQGQGYYRVTYALDLWNRIIETLENPVTRNQIHPLNRATLVDDALNVARAGRLDYDIAFKLILSMEHETEYAPWKAFVRNMDFVRKRLTAYTRIDEDLDSNIYLRIINKAVRAFEDQIGFYPDVSTYEPEMQKLTRSLVTDHACRVNYQPCIVAAKNWFYDPNNKKIVNPNIPHDIRPAVYCTMVREGDEKVIETLKARLEIEPTLYERLVIFESLACSQDAAFINRLLAQTIAPDSPYSIEERVKIFAAVAGSSYANANLAHDFLRLRTLEIRKMYGGAEKLEQVIFNLADNLADDDISSKFSTWVNDLNNNVQDSQLAADRALEQVNENVLWDASFNNYVYFWIAEHVS